MMKEREGGEFSIGVPTGVANGADSAPVRQAMAMHLEGNSLCTR